MFPLIFMRREAGLVGESGSGKTTVGRTILKLYDFDDGDITFAGQVSFQHFWERLERIPKVGSDDFPRPTGQLEWPDEDSGYCCRRFGHSQIDFLRKNG